MSDSDFDPRARARRTAPDDDRRDAERRRSDEVPHITMRATGAGEVTLVDLSGSGARFVSERRFLPNAEVSLRLVTPDGDVVVATRVVRSRMIQLPGGEFGYDVAVTFLEPVQPFGTSDESGPSVGEETSDHASTTPDVVTASTERSRDDVRHLLKHRTP